MAANRRASGQVEAKAIRMREALAMTRAATLSRRQEVALRIAKGERIAVIQVRNQQAQRVRDITQEQALQRNGHSR